MCECLIYAPFFEGCEIDGCVCVSYLINAYLCSQSLGFACDALIALHTFRRSGLKIELRIYGLKLRQPPAPHALANVMSNVCA